MGFYVSLYTTCFAWIFLVHGVSLCLFFFFSSPLLYSHLKNKREERRKIKAFVRFWGEGKVLRKKYLMQPPSNPTLPLQGRPISGSYSPNTLNVALREEFAPSPLQKRLIEPELLSSEVAGKEEEFSGVRYGRRSLFLCSRRASASSRRRGRVERVYSVPVLRVCARPAASVRRPVAETRSLCSRRAAWLGAS